MPEERVAAVEQILHYAYYGKVLQTIAEADNFPALCDGFTTIVNTYVLAEKWCMEELGNDLIDQLRLEYQTWNVIVSQITDLRESGLGDSQMRQLMLQQLAANIRKKEWACYIENLCDHSARLIDWYRRGGDDVVDLLWIC